MTRNLAGSRLSPGSLTVKVITPLDLWASPHSVMEMFLMGTFCFIISAGSSLG